MKKAIVGYGGFGREIYHSLSLSDKKNCAFFVEDVFFKKDEKTMPISRFDPNEYELIIAIGDPKTRERIVNSLPLETKYFTHINETAKILGDDVKIGEGSIICAGTIITTNVKIGNHSHLNLLTTIGHDSIIGDYFTTAPGVQISGNSNIGNRVYFGTRSCNREKTIICDDVVIGLNSGVIQNINKPGVYVGTPAIKIK